MNGKKWRKRVRNGEKHREIGKTCVGGREALGSGENGHERDRIIEKWGK